MAAQQKPDAMVNLVRKGIKKIKKDLSEGAPVHHRPKQYQRFDKVVISTVPRFKESPVSGSEWRLGSKIEFMKKGKVIFIKETGSGVESTLNRMPEHLQDDDLAEAVMDSREALEGFCDQEGCSAAWTRTYKLKNTFCDGCARPENTHDPRPLVVRFCDRHSDRGSQSYEDCNGNYDMGSNTPILPPDEDRVTAQLRVVMG